MIRSLYHGCWVCALLAAGMAVVRMACTEARIPAREPAPVSMPDLPAVVEDADPIGFRPDPAAPELSVRPQQDLFREGLQNRVGLDDLRACIPPVGPETIVTLLAEMESCLESDPRADIWEYVLLSWAEFSPGEAFDYMQSKRKGMGAAPWVMSLWVADEARGPEGYMESATDLEIRNEALWYYTTAAYMQDPGRIRSWVETLPASGKLKEAVLEHWAVHAARAESFEESAAMLGPWFGRPEGARAAAAFAAEWGWRDPEATWAWTRGLPPETGTAAVSEFMLRWAGTNPSEAGDWLNEQPPGTALDPAIEAYMWIIQDVSPETALTWASALTDPDRMRLAVIKIPQLP